MSPTDAKEMIDRLRRMESRMVVFAQLMGVDLLGTARKAEPQCKFLPGRGFYVEIATLDTTMARIRKVVAENLSLAGKVPVYFEDKQVGEINV